MSFDERIRTLGEVRTAPLFDMVVDLVGMVIAAVLAPKKATQ